MARFQVLAFALLSALYSCQVGAAKLRSLAQVPFLPVHRHLASCPLTTGVDYVGNDVKNVAAAQAADCCALCSQTANCGAFTWTNHLGGTCWLKSAKGSTASNAGAISAVLVPDTPGCTLKDGVDFQGNDIGNVKNPNAGSCCSICSSWTGCRAFTWSNQDGGTCWLKSVKGAEIGKPGVKSAEVSSQQCALQNDIDFVGNDIGNTPGSNAGACCSICKTWSGCRSYTWSNQNGGTCWLKSAKGSTVSKAGVVSSQVLDNPQSSCTLEANVDYVGNDVGNVPAPKPSDCCAKCRAKPGCGAFSWSSLNGGTCWLKSSKGATTNANGVTSAVVT